MGARCGFGSNFDRPIRINYGRAIVTICLCLPFWIIAGPVLSWAQAAATSVQNPLITEIRVNIQGHPDPNGKLQHMGRRLIRLHPGDRFSAVLVEKSIQALERSRRFEHINVDSMEDRDRFELVFSLKPYPLIKDIRIRNASPIFEQDILNSISTKVGDTYIPASLPRQQEQITRLYQQEGYIAPIVDIRSEVDSADGNCTLHIHLDKGPYYKLQKLTFEGNKSFAEFELKRRMRLWRSSLSIGKSARFVEKDLSEDLNTLTEIYRKRSFFDAVVKSAIKKDRNAQGVQVTILIDEGPRYQLELIGNHAFTTYTLKKDLVFSKEGNRNRRGERKSIKNIETRYRKAGFTTVKIDIERDVTKQAEKKQVALRFVIEEGPKTVVAHLKILGNKTFSDAVIKESMLSRPPRLGYGGSFSLQRLEDDVRAVKLHYTNNGFLQVDVHAETRFDSARKKVDIDMVIDENLQTRISGVSFSGMTLITRRQALNAILLKPGEPFREYLVKSDENVISALIAAKGHPHVKVNGSYQLSADRSSVDLSYTVDEGTFVRMGQVSYWGNFRTRRTILEREWELAPGDPFSSKKLLASQRSIRNLDIFENVTYQSLGYTQREAEIDMVVKVEERKPYFFELGTGYVSDRGLFANTRIGDRNLFGMNREAWIAGEVSEVGYRIESSIREPRLFGSRAALNFRLFGESKEEFNQTFGTSSWGSSLGLRIKPMKRITTELDVKYEYRDQFASDGEKIPLQIDGDDEFEPRNVLVATPRIQYDSRDSFIKPEKGFFSIGYVDISKGIENKLDDYLRFRLDAKYFWTPYDRMTFAVIGRGGHIEPYNSSGLVPSDQLFYLGGITDVRGFEENTMIADNSGDPVGGLSFLSSSVEARIDLGSGWELPLFIDIGWIGDIIGQEAKQDPRTSIGTGLRYSTPIGPIGILYAYKLDRKSGESPGEYYFSIGYTF